MNHQKRAEIITASLLSIVLSVALIVVGLQITVHVFDQGKVDNSKRLTDFGQTISDLSSSSADNFSYFLRLSEKDVFLFFSEGNGPIYLETSQKPTNYLSFARPDLPECKDRACICHCTEGPFWRKDVTDTVKAGLVPKNLFLNIGNPSSGGAFSCKPIKCIGNPVPKDAQFGNSRGFVSDSKYFDLIWDAVDLANDKARETYYPIPFDIVILSQNDDAKQHNLFFSTAFGADYNNKKQDKDYVKLLVNDYKWDGGVVIGGMGYADKRHAKKKELLAPKIVLRFEKPAGYGNVFGVCIHDQCLFDAAKKNLQSRSQSASLTSDLVSTFDDLKKGFVTIFDRCYQAKQAQNAIGFCYEELQYKTIKPFLTQTYTGINSITPSIQFTKPVDAYSTAINPKINYEVNKQQFTKNADPILPRFPFPLIQQKNKKPQSIVNGTRIIAFSGGFLQLSTYSGNYELTAYYNATEKCYYPLFQEK